MPASPMIVVSIHEPVLRAELAIPIRLLMSCGQLRSLHWIGPRQSRLTTMASPVARSLPDLLHPTRSRLALHRSTHARNSLSPYHRIAPLATTSLAYCSTHPCLHHSLRRTSRFLLSPFRLIRRFHAPQGSDGARRRAWTTSS